MRVTRRWVPLALLAAVSMPSLAWAQAGGMIPTAVDGETPAGGATASPGSGASTNGLEEIIVTARKRAENVQDVPISVSVVSSATLQQQGATLIADVVKFTPNAQIRAHPSDPTSAILGFRGQVQTDQLSTLDPSVGVYVDGLYWARAYGANADLLDIERVEVLKGPQGTLFGRNTTGGALNIKTADPDLNDIKGRLSASYGSYDEWNLTGIASLPIVADRIAVRAAVSHSQSDGYGRELVTGKRLFGYDSWTGRGKLLVQATETLSILLNAEYFRYNGDAPAPKVIYATSPASLEVSLESGGRDSIQNYIGGDPYKVAIGFVPKVRTRTHTYGGTAKLDTSFGSITAIAGYRDFDSKRNNDLDGVPYNVLDPYLFAHGHQWSAEVQFAGKSFDDRFEWTAGTFWFDEHIPRDGALNTALPALNPNSPARQLAEVTNRSLAMFGQGNFHFTDRFSVTAGLRYSIDDRRMNSFNSAGGPTGTRTCSIPLALRLAPAVCEAKFHRDDGAISYTLSANYQPDSNLLFYAKTSRSFRGGGFQLRGGGSVESYSPFDPESVTDYEVGLKAELFDRRVRFNAAGFYSDYKDVQRSLIVPVVGGGVATIVNNAAKAHIWGGEAELTAIPFDGFEITGTLGVTKPKYDRFVDATGDRSNERFEYVPDYTASVSPQYTLKLPSGDIVARADWNYQSSYVTPKNALPPFTRQKGYQLVNARLSYKLTEPNIEVAAYARNLFDKRYAFTLQDLLTAGLGYINAHYGPPRQLGVQVSYRFGD